LETSSLTVSCADGQVAVALNVQDFGEPLAYGLRCGTLTMKAGILGVFPVVSDVADTRFVPATESASGNLAVACPASTVMIGVTGTQNSVESTNPINTIAARCAGAGGASVSGPMITLRTAFYNTDPFDLECPMGEVVTGLGVDSSGSSLVPLSLSLRCQ
jgi:hypothetical protein